MHNRERLARLHAFTEDQAADTAEAAILRASRDLADAIAVGLLAEPLQLTAVEAHEIGARISRPALTMVIAALMDTLDTALLPRDPSLL